MHTLHVQVLPDEDEQSAAVADKETEAKAKDHVALPVRVRHHGLHQGIVSQPGIHGLEEQLSYEIDTVVKPCEQSKLRSSEQVHTPEALTSEELWRRCAAKVPDWSYWYTTYHHFRSKVSTWLALLSRSVYCPFSWHLECLCFVRASMCGAPALTCNALPWNSVMSQA